MEKITKLTDSFLKKVQCDYGKKFIKFSDPSLKSLYIFVYPSGKKIFKIRQKNDSYVKLGEYPLFSLAELREMALNALRYQAKGQSVQNAKRQKFGEIYEEVLNQCERNNFAKKTIQRGRSYQNGVFKCFEKRNINEIKRSEIIEVLKSLEGRSATLEKAKVWINKVFEYALQLEIIEHNPVSSIKNHIVFQKPKETKHQPTLLEDAKIKEYLNALQSSNLKQKHKNLMLFVLLTAQRPGNVIKAMWDEIDLKNGLWVIPSYKMKMRKEHTIVLSSAALKILKAQKKMRVNAYVFAGSSKKGHNSENITCNINKRLGYQGVQSAHGFRAMFRSLANEHQLTHQVSMDIAEQCLAHEQKNAILKAYNRSRNLELMRKLMQWWADYLENLGLKC